MEFADSAENSGTTEGRENAECDGETLENANRFEASDEPSHAIEHSSRLKNRAGIAEKSQQPDDRGAGDAGAVEQPDEGRSDIARGTRRAICVEAEFEFRIVFADQIAEQSGQIDCGVILFHGAVIDDARYGVAGEENVIVPQIAEARLHGDGTRQALRQYALGRLDESGHGFRTATERFISRTRKRR